MKQLRSWIAVGTLTPILLALALPAQEISFAPAEGLQLTKSITFSVSSNVDDMEVVVDGNPMPAPPIEVETAQTTSLTVTDRYVKTEGGRTLVLMRTFDSLSSEMDLAMEHPMQGAQEVEATSASDLEGTTVVFTWNEDDEQYDVEFAEDSADEDEALLEGLVQEIDMSGFLPEGSVSEDDSWVIEPRTLLSVLVPGGSLALVPQDAPAGMDLSAGMDFSAQLGDLEGDCTATFTGTRSTDDGTLAVIQITMEASSEKDITEFMAEAAANNEQAEAMGMEQDIQSADASFEFILEGELIWNVDGGHFHSMEMSGTTEVVIDLALGITAMGKSMEVENAIYSSGTVEVSATATPVSPDSE